jgi:sulfur carrier protein ThiS
MTDTAREMEKETISVTIRCNVSVANGERRYPVGERFTRQFPSHTVVRSVIDSLGILDTMVGIVLVNSELVTDRESIVFEGDHIDVFPLVSGG